MRISDCLLKSATRSALMRNERDTHIFVFDIELPRDAPVWDLISML
jgi:hypothetical protein